jgi:hypothetical protein
MPTRPRRPAVSIALAALAIALATSPPLAAQQPSPYAGLESRPIKALSAEQIEQYRNGEGMGLAMAAELNDYPGPKHVLELETELELTDEQRRAVQASYDAMHAEAVRFGDAIVERERRLDAMFAEATVTEETLRQTLDEIGRLQAELRRAHIAAHLETRLLLEPAQIERYSALRGYTGEGAHQHGHGHGHDHGHPGHAGHSPGR